MLSSRSHRYSHANSSEGLRAGVSQYSQRSSDMRARRDYEDEDEERDEDHREGKGRSEERVLGIPAVPVEPTPSEQCDHDDRGSNDYAG